MPHTDVPLTLADIQAVASMDHLAALIERLGYDLSHRRLQRAKDLGLSDEVLKGIVATEILSHGVLPGDPHTPFQVHAFLLQSVSRTSVEKVARAFQDRAGKFLICFADARGFETLAFAIPARDDRGSPVLPLRIVRRRAPSRADLRALRRLTLTEADAILQAGKVARALDDARWSDDFFVNRGLFSDYYLKERLPSDHGDLWERDPARPFQALGEPWRRGRDRLLSPAGDPSAHPTEADTRAALIEPMLRALGFSLRPGKAPDSPDPEADYLAVPEGRDGPVVPVLAHVLDRNLDGPDPQRDPHTPDENPAVTVVEVLDRHAPCWAILTNGRRWRLYGSQAESRATQYYEVDLSEVFADPTDAGDAFRYFWLFFRAQAFLPGPDGSRSFLDRVFQASRDYAKRLGESLRDEIFDQAFPILAQGILRAMASPEGPGDLSPERMQSVKDLALRLLYRILFVAYAEARDLLPVSHPGYRDRSLRQIAREIAGEAGKILDKRDDGIAKFYRTDSHALWDRLASLFSSIANGDPACNLPPYDGGLFEDPVPVPPLDDRTLARILDRLLRAEDDRLYTLESVDYKTLGVRQLGSIYEGLLEYHLRPDPDGSVHLENDRGDRRASGSYYTPEFVVRFLVERTLDPLLESHFESFRDPFRRYQKEVRDFDEYQRRAQAAGLPLKDPAQRSLLGRDLALAFLEFRVLDPAMGSGHFLVRALDHLTDRMLEFLAAFPENPVRAMLDDTRDRIRRACQQAGVQVPEDRLDDISLLRRHVLKQCLFGVDLNPLAVELAKVSLWLHSFTVGAPLSFLDHHLRCGNSLVGAHIATVQARLDQGGELFGSAFHGLLSAAHTLIEVGRRSDVTLEQVHETRAQFVQASGFLSPFGQVLDLWCAHRLGVPEVEHLFVTGRVPEVREDWIAYLSPKDRALARRGLEAATPWRPFHFEIAFPEVFYDHRGRRPDGGFHAVVGNPPYVRQELLGPDFKQWIRSAFPEVFDSIADLYCYFYAQGHRLLRPGGRLGMITQDKFLRAAYGRKLRDFLARQAGVREVVLFGGLPVFEDATTYACILVVDRDPGTHRVRFLQVRELGPSEEAWLQAVFDREAQEQDVESLQAGPAWVLGSSREVRILQRMREAGEPLQEYLRRHGAVIHRGIMTGLNEAFFLDRATRDRLIAEDPRSAEVIQPLIVGDDVRRYRIRDQQRFLLLTRIGVPIREYRAVFRHLQRFQEKLKRRTDQGEHWWELRACDYYHEFEQPKIVYPVIAMSPRFAMDRAGFHCNDKCFHIPLEDWALLAVLNSQVTFGAIRLSTSRLKGGRGDETRELRAVHLVGVPIPRLDDRTRETLAQWARRRTEIEATRPEVPTRGRRPPPPPDPEALELDREIDRVVARAFGLTDEDLDFLTRPGPDLEEPR